MRNFLKLTFVRDIVDEKNLKLKEESSFNFRPKLSEKKFNTEQNILKSNCITTENKYANLGSELFIVNLYIITLI